MKKLFIRGGVVVVLLLAVLLAVGFFALNPIVKNLVESQGTAGTGVATRLESVNLSPFSGSASLNGLMLANPAGFEGDIFELGRAEVEVKTLSALGSEVVVPKVVIDGATVRVAYKDGKLNVMELVKQLKSDSGSEPEEGGAGKSFVIQNLSITNTKVQGEIALPGLSAQEINLAIADIKKTDVRGAEMKDVINLVVETVMLNAASGLGGVMPNLGALVGDLEGIADAKLQEVQGQLDDATADVEKKVDETLGDVEKKLGGFIDGLGKKKEPSE